FWSFLFSISYPPAFFSRFSRKIKKLCAPFSSFGAPVFLNHFKSYPDTSSCPPNIVPIRFCLSSQQRLMQFQQPFLTAFLLPLIQNWSRLVYTKRLQSSAFIYCSTPTFDIEL
ncbi:MAG: hypothetical protein RR716_03410, partial [Christensenellaceae bacterium]